LPEKKTDTGAEAESDEKRQNEFSPWKEERESD
jgi:hypothetical protein